MMKKISISQQLASLLIIPEGAVFNIKNTSKIMEILNNHIDEVSRYHAELARANMLFRGAELIDEKINQNSTGWGASENTSSQLARLLAKGELMVEEDRDIIDSILKLNMPINNRNYSDVFSVNFHHLSIAKKKKLSSIAKKISAIILSYSDEEREKCSNYFPKLFGFVNNENEKRIQNIPKITKKITQEVKIDVTRIKPKLKENKFIYQGLEKINRNDYLYIDYSVMHGFHKMHHSIILLDLLDLSEKYKIVAIDLSFNDLGFEFLGDKENKLCLAQILYHMKDLVYINFENNLIQFEDIERGKHVTFFGRDATSKNVLDKLMESLSYGAKYEKFFLSIETSSVEKFECEITHSGKFSSNRPRTRKPRKRDSKLVHERCAAILKEKKKSSILQECQNMKDKFSSVNARVFFDYDRRNSNDEFITHEFKSGHG